MDNDGIRYFKIIVRRSRCAVGKSAAVTYGKNIYYCKLNTDEAIAQTTLGVDTDTGWLSGDTIAIASTSRTQGDCESRVLDANANASDMTVTAGLSAAHSGTSPTQAEVILLTRNVSVFGASAALQTFIDIKNTATVDIDWTEFYWLGSGTANKQGISSVTSTGALSIQYSSLHDFSVNPSNGLYFGASSGNGFTYSNNVSYNIYNQHVTVTAGNSGTWTMDSNIFIKNTSAVPLVALNDIGGTFTNNIMVSSATTSGVSLAEANATLGTFSGNACHSGGGFGSGSGYTGTISNCSAWRCTSYGYGGGGAANYINGLTISDCTFFGNTSYNVYLVNCGEVIFNNVTMSGDSSFSTTSGLDLGNGGSSYGR